MNGDEMTLRTMINVDAMYPVLPCAVNVAISCTQCGLDLTVSALLVGRLFGNHLDSFPSIFFTQPPSPQTDGGDSISGR